MHTGDGDSISSKGLLKGRARRPIGASIAVKRAIGIGTELEVTAELDVVIPDPGREYDAVVARQKGENEPGSVASPAWVCPSGRPTRLRMGTGREGVVDRAPFRYHHGA